MPHPPRTPEPAMSVTLTVKRLEGAAAAAASSSAVAASDKLRVEVDVVGAPEAQATQPRRVIRGSVAWNARFRYGVREDKGFAAQIRVVDGGDGGDGDVLSEAALLVPPSELRDLAATGDERVVELAVGAPQLSPAVSPTARLVLLLQSSHLSPPAALRGASSAQRRCPSSPALSVSPSPSPLQRRRMPPPPPPPLPLALGGDAGLCVACGTPAEPDGNFCGGCGMPVPGRWGGGGGSNNDSQQQLRRAAAASTSAQRRRTAEAAAACGDSTTPPPRPPPAAAAAAARRASPPPAGVAQAPWVGAGLYDEIWSARGGAGGGGGPPLLPTSQPPPPVAKAEEGGGASLKTQMVHYARVGRYTSSPERKRARDAVQLAAQQRSVERVRGDRGGVGVGGGFLPAAAAAAAPVERMPAGATAAVVVEQWDPPFLSVGATPAVMRFEGGPRHFAASSAAAAAAPQHQAVHAPAVTHFQHSTRSLLFPRDGRSGSMPLHFVAKDRGRSGH